MTRPALTVSYLDHRTTRTHPERMVVRVYSGALADWQNGGRDDKDVQQAAIEELHFIHAVYKEVLRADFSRRNDTGSTNGRLERDAAPTV